MTTVSQLTLNVQRLYHIVVYQLEVLMADPVLHVALPTREEVVHHRHFVPIHHQLVRQVGSDEPCPSSDLHTEMDDWQVSTKAGLYTEDKYYLIISQSYTRKNNNTEN